MAVERMYELASREKGIEFHMSFYEIYGGRVLDLLNNKKKVEILEDGNNFVQIQGITEKEAKSPDEMKNIIDYGHKARTTHATMANNTSSRSHAICQIYITQNNKFKGKLILCDLAGSERAQDTQSNSRQRRLEGAGINKSLLALKECIRAMHSKQSHIPFRASKLTLALRDSFKSDGLKSKIVMVACVCPGSSSSDHTINTLRYADRLKMKQNRNIKPMSNQSKGRKEQSGGNIKKRVESSPKMQKRSKSKNRKVRESSNGKFKSPPKPSYPGGKMDSIDEGNPVKPKKDNGSRNKWNERKKSRNSDSNKRDEKGTLIILKIF